MMGVRVMCVRVMCVRVMCVRVYLEDVDDTSSRLYKIHMRKYDIVVICIQSNLLILEVLYTN